LSNRSSAKHCEMTAIYSCNPMCYHRSLFTAALMHKTT